MSAEVKAFQEEVRAFEQFKNVSRTITSAR